LNPGTLPQTIKKPLQYKMPVKLDMQNDS